MKDNNDNKNKIRKRKLSSSKGEQPKTSPAKPTKSHKFKYLRAFAIMCLAILVIGSAIGTGVVFASLKDAEPITKAVLDKKTTARSVVYNSNGLKMYETPSPVKKSVVPIDKIPKDMKNAIVSIEDERFYKHHGVDLSGLARAVAINIFTSKAPGGSTLNMQVSKMLLTNTNKSITRKIKDIYYAHEMDKELTKDQVLELYLNNFPVGRGAEGVQAGAKAYFNKDVSELTLSECAILAGITQNPNKYTVYTTARLDGSETKKDLENKLIYYENADKQFDAPTEIELKMVDKLNAWGLLPNSDYYSELKSGHLVVRKATLNEESKKRQLTVLWKMHELKYITDEEYEKAKTDPINISIPKPEDRISSYVETLVEKEVINDLKAQGHTDAEAKTLYYSGGLKINTTIDPNIQGILESEFSKGANFPGTLPATASNNKSGIPQPQGAMIIIDHSTGQIKGLVGGREVKGSKTLNRVIVPRQPGSTIKPLSVYTPAIDAGMTQADVKSDVRGGYKFTPNKKWNPRTTTAGSGQMTLRKGLAKSSNIVAAKVAEDLGDTYEKCISTMVDYLDNFGITTIQKQPNKDNKTDLNFSSLTLGGLTNGAMPIQMASAYGSLANGGNYIEPSIVTSIQGPDGQVLSKKAPKQHKVVDSQVAYIMTDMMTSAVKDYGTARRARLNSDMPVAGKTGTTNDDKEAWFVGYTPYYVGATVIADDYGSITGGIRPVTNGSSTSAQLWSNVMNRVHSKLTVKQFKKPSGIEMARINLETGGIAHYEGYSTDSAAFKEGTIPSKGSYIHEDSEEESSHSSGHENSDNEDSNNDSNDGGNDGGSTHTPPSTGHGHGNGNNTGNDNGNSSGNDNGGSTDGNTGNGNSSGNGNDNTGGDNGAGSGNTPTTPTPQTNLQNSKTPTTTTKPGVITTPGTTTNKQ